MPNSEPKSLQGYKEYVRKRLAVVIPIIQKAAVGDFSQKIDIPKEEDEFSELFVGLSLMLDDLTLDDDFDACDYIYAYN